MFTKALLQYEQDRMGWRGPRRLVSGVLRSPAAFPLWLAAWSGVHCMLNLLDSPCGTADCLVFQTAKQPLHLGHTLLGAYENGDLNVLQEAIDFAMGREFFVCHLR